MCAPAPRPLVTPAECFCLFAGADSWCLPKEMWMGDIMGQRRKGKEGGKGKEWESVWEREWERERKRERGEKKGQGRRENKRENKKKTFVD